MLIPKILSSKYFDYLIVIAILAVSAYIRFQPIFNGDFPFLYDHGRDMLDVRKIVVDRDLALIGPTTGLQGLFHSPLHYYLLSIAFILTGGNPASGVGMTALFAVIASFACYFLGKKLFGRFFGITAAAIYAFAPGSISSTTMFWNPNWIPMVMVPFYFALYRGITTDKRYLALAFLLAGLITQFEAAFGIFLLPTIFILLLIFNRKFIWSKALLFGLFLFGLTFIWFPVFEAIHGFNMTKTIYGMLSGSKQSLGEAIPFAIRLDYRITELVRVTISAFAREALVGWIYFALFIATTALAVIKKRTEVLKNILFFAFIPLIYLFWFMIFPFPAWTYYWIGLQVGFYLFAAYCLTILYQNRNIFLKIVAVSAFVIWLGLTVKLPGDNTYTDAQIGTYKNMLAVVDYVYEDRGQEPFGVFVYTPPIYSYAYDYIFWWRGKTKYNYIPDDSKKGLFYLVIEPNDGKPFDIDGWKKTKIVTGKTEWIKDFRGGVQVEKRNGSGE
jgi:hypothetical protein